MKSLRNSNVLSFNLDTLPSVRNLYNLEKPGEMDEAVDIMQTWVKQHNYFIKKDYPRAYLESSIINAKGSIEKAKNRMEKLCMYKTLLPDFFDEYNIRNLFEGLEKVEVALMPKMTKDHERIVVYRIFVDKIKIPDFSIKIYKVFIMLMEYFRKYDYAHKYIFVSDTTQLNHKELLSNLNIVHLHQFINIMKNGYGVNLKNVHLFRQNSTFSDTIFNILKQAIKSRGLGKVIIHGSKEELYQYIPRELLPADFGGEQKSLAELKKLLVDELSTEENRKYIQEMYAARTDESRRPKDNDNEEIMGINGTFRSLTID